MHFKWEHWMQMHTQKNITRTLRLLEMIEEHGEKKEVRLRIHSQRIISVIY